VPSRSRRVVKKGIENLIHDISLDSLAVVFNIHHHRVEAVDITAANGNEAFLPRLNRLMGVDQQIGHHLFDLLEVSANRRNIGGDVLFDGGDRSADLRAHDDQRARDHLRHRHQFFLRGFVGTGKFLQAGHDPADPVGADFKRLNNLLHIAADVFIGQAPLFPFGMVGAGTGKNGFHGVPDLFEDRHVVGNEADGIVDLVGDAGHDFAQRRQFVRLNHLLEAKLALLADSLVFRDVLPRADDIIGRTGGQLHHPPVI